MAGQGRSDVAKPGGKDHRTDGDRDVRRRRQPVAREPGLQRRRLPRTPAMVAKPRRRSPSAQAARCGGACPERAGYSDVDVIQDEPEHDGRREVGDDDESIREDILQQGKVAEVDQGRGSR